MLAVLQISALLVFGLLGAVYALVGIAVFCVNLFIGGLSNDNQVTSADELAEAIRRGVLWPWIMLRARQAHRRSVKRRECPGGRCSRSKK